MSADAPPRGGSPWRWRAFELGLRPWLWTRLAGIQLAGLPDPGTLDPARPLVLVSNHTSWYDGFLLRALHRELRPDGALLTLMLERELRKAPVLGFIGGVGFDPERPATLRGALRQVEAAAARASARTRARGAGPAPTLSFFPQGTITPATRRPLGFRKGVELVARRLAPAYLLPVAVRLEAGRKIRPTAWVLAGEPVVAEPSGPVPGAEVLEARVTALLDRIAGHLHDHGEGAEGAWPPAPPPAPPPG